MLAGQSAAGIAGHLEAVGILPVVLDSAVADTEKHQEVAGIRRVVAQVVVGAEEFQGVAGKRMDVVG